MRVRVTRCWSLLGFMLAPNVLILEFPFQVGHLANTTTTRISRPFDAPASGLPAGWIPGSAGRPQTPRHLSNCAAFTPFNAGHVRAGDVGYWNTGARLTPG